MFFPSPSKRFDGVISKKKNEYYSPFRSTEAAMELIEKTYVSKSNDSEAMEVVSMLGRGRNLEPCKTVVDAVKLDSSLSRGLEPCKTVVDSVKLDSLLSRGLQPCIKVVDSSLGLAVEPLKKTKIKKDKRLKVESELDLSVEHLKTTKVKKGKRLKVESELDLSVEPLETTKIQKGENLKAGPGELDLSVVPLETTKIKKGEYLKGGLKQFLSNNGRTEHLVRFKKGCYGPFEHVDFDSLHGKYLFITCFSVPMFSDAYVVEECLALIETYDHFSRVGHPFELVVVVKMISDAAYDQKAAFDHFYSAFSSCLAIPFSDVATRDYITSCFMGRSILVDPKGLILDGTCAVDAFINFGSEWSPPFLNTTLDELWDQDDALRSRLDPMYALAHGFVNQDQPHLSLYGDILLCSPDLVLRRFDAETDVASTVLDLTSKYVGLYLCFDGGIMEQIKAAHDYCLANKHQLEIVLVCMSLFDEPHSYYQDLYQTLRLFNIKSWFLFDYDSKVCRRMWRIFGQGYIFPGEKFIIIPPNCESAELRGRDIIIENGITGYPFTRTAILKRRLEFVRSLSPVHLSLFKTGLFQNGKEYNSEQLRGKNLILYLDSLYSDRCQDLYDLLMKHYPEMKAIGWEIVFVPLGVASFTETYWNRQMESRVVVTYPFTTCSFYKKMPWPVMSPSAVFEASVEEKLTCPEEDLPSLLIAVGKDGNIVSRRVEDKLEAHGVTESLFDDVLETDLARELANMPYSEDYY